MTALLIKLCDGKQRVTISAQQWKNKAVWWQDRCNLYTVCRVREEKKHLLIAEFWWHRRSRLLSAFLSECTVHQSNIFNTVLSYGWWRCFLGRNTHQHVNILALDERKWTLYLKGAHLCPTKPFPFYLQV